MKQDIGEIRADQNNNFRQIMEQLQSLKPPSITPPTAPLSIEGPALETGVQERNKGEGGGESETDFGDTPFIETMPLSCWKAEKAN